MRVESLSERFGEAIAFAEPKRCVEDAARCLLEELLTR